MVLEAPRFYEVAKQVVEITEGCIFVAHNARFDYSFVKKEFSDLGYNYQRKTLCTVRLGRKVVPGLKSYGLKNITKHFAIPLESHHRAGQDARATALLLGILLKYDNGNEAAGSLVDAELKSALLPPALDKEKIAALPDLPGVYFFYDDAGRTLYVGKSVNIRKRVVSHFQIDVKERKSVEFKSSIADISHELMGNELIALLYESYLIKKIKPVYNRALRRSRYRYGVFCATDENGYLNLRIDRISGQADKPVTPVNSLVHGKELLYKFVEKYALCQKYCTLFKTSGACFGYQVGMCDGACVQAIPPEVYNERVELAIKHYAYVLENFFIVGTGRRANERSVTWVENGIYRGFGFIDADQPVERPEDLSAAVMAYGGETKDVQQIIRGYMRKLPAHDIVWSYNETGKLKKVSTRKLKTLV